MPKYSSTTLAGNACSSSPAHYRTWHHSPYNFSVFPTTFPYYRDKKALLFCIIVVLGSLVNVKNQQEGNKSVNICTGAGRRILLLVLMCQSQEKQRAGIDWPE